MKKTIKKLERYEYSIKEFLKVLGLSGEIELLLHEPNKIILEVVR